ncbi:MAG: ChrB protein [Planctomycetia bacterium]|nr:ChrB protein [Planctomycetia bacterium]
MKRWVQLVYKIPREPTAGRVKVWRKLKQLGAVALQDAVWVLPATSRTQEQFQWLAAEIVELGGEATLFTSELVFADNADALIDQFEEPVRKAYQEILKALKRKDHNLPELARRFQKIQSRDYFQSKLGTEVRTRLLKARGKGPS